MRIPFISLAAAGAIALGGCAYGGVGLGYGYGDYGYGYGGYGGYYGSPYYGLGSRYGGWYGSPYWGWYDNFYYPGTGIYVYDIYRRPHRWSDRQKRYWVSRRPAVTTTTRTVIRPNWSSFDRERTVRTNRVTFDRPSRSERLQQVQERRGQRVTNGSSRPKATRVRPITGPD